jgi:hypothetical protein
MDCTLNKKRFPGIPYPSGTLSETHKRIRKGFRSYLEFRKIPSGFPGLRKLIGFRENESENPQPYSLKSWTLPEDQIVFLGSRF